MSSEMTSRLRTFEAFPGAPSVEIQRNSLHPSHSRLLSPRNTVANTNSAFQVVSPLANVPSDTMQRPTDEEAQATHTHPNPIQEENPKPPKFVPNHGDTSATYWELYGSEAVINDNKLVESIKGNTQSMVFLTSLFSSIVASFIIEIYKTLLHNDQQILDSPPADAVRFNIILFLSFFLSVMSAVSCALIQQWCDEYMQYAYPRAAPHTRGRVRTYLYRGLKASWMERFLSITHVLLHISVFLFFWAISDFFYAVNHHLGTVAHCALVALLIVYFCLSISPLIFSTSPYNTPMTLPLRGACIILRVIIRFPLWCLRRIRGQKFGLIGLQHYKGISFDKARLFLIEAEKQAEQLEPYAMEWLFTENDFSDTDMDKFLEGLPGYMSSDHTKKDRLDGYLTAGYILGRIKQHFITCATSVELSGEASIARVSSCVQALRRIFENNSDPNRDSEGKLKSRQGYIQELIGEFRTLCDMGDPKIALRASCIRALAVQGLVSELVSSTSKSTELSQLPKALLPLYKFFFPNDNVDSTRGADEIERMWEVFQHDVPLANMRMLAEAVRRSEDAPPSSLSFCWTTLDILLRQLGTIRSEDPQPVQIDFDGLHESVRTYVHSGERGFRVKPLLEILDTVGRGRRLLSVFSGRPEYYNRADVVFGKEYLRNSDLLEAFARCLPDFISKNTAEDCRHFMEKVVCNDDLWTSLQVNLWNTKKSDSPTPDKLRVFENCCTVLDVTLSALEDSQKVDWRAPEFGSLAQHFESFITHCFQGSFMGRATCFRVGLIRARFCKALLAQFQNDLNLEGTVSFRSQWDVASLARLICAIGVRDENDPEFWDSYVDGGHIGAELTAKARETAHITKRDGPLLIFCKLGHMAASAVPLALSDIEPKDIEEVWELQDKLIKDERLPLDYAFDTVWEELGQLREHVRDLWRKNTDQDKEILGRLLRAIEDVYNRRSFRSEDPGQGRFVEEHGPNTSVVENSTWSRRVSRGISFASGSTAVTGKPSGGTRTGEEGSADQGLDHERKASEGSESPQSIPGIGIVDRSIGTPPPARPRPPVAPHFSHERDPNWRRSSTSPRRTGSGSSPPRLGIATRAGTSVSLTSSIDAFAVPPIPGIRSYRSFDLSDEGQSGTPPTFKEE